MSDCIFCKIANHQIPSKIVLEDDNILAFEDLNPQAPVHILLIPKRHIARLTDLEEENGPLIGGIVTAANTVAVDRGIAQSGYRLVANCNADGGQTVDHIHFHLMGGRRMNWPPG